VKKQSSKRRIAKIDALIDRAYALAQRRLQQHVEAGGSVSETRVSGSSDSKGDTSYKHFFLIEFYHDAMNELTREAGLRNI